MKTLQTNYAKNTYSCRALLLITPAGKRELSKRQNTTETNPFMLHQKTYITTRTQTKEKSPVRESAEPQGKL
jgi:hypothetical protein